MNRQITVRRSGWWLAVLMLTIGIATTTFHQSVEAARLTNAKLELNNPVPGAVVQYKLSFDFAETSTLGALSIEVCSNSPLEEAACTPPSGSDISQAAIISQLGETGFSVSSTSTANRLDLVRSPQLRTASSGVYEIGNVVNPVAKLTYYVKVKTFVANDTTGSYTDFGAFSFDISPSFDITATVPPFLYFCVANSIPGDCTTADGTLVDLGELSSTRANTSKSEMMVFANAAGGYNVRATGSTLASGSNEITALTDGAPSLAGTSQFGLNLALNNNPVIGRVHSGGSGNPMPRYSVANSFRFDSGEVIASSPRSDVADKYTISYLVNIPRTQPGGVYVTTLTYICLANF